MTDTDVTPELTLETVTEVPIADLNEDQTNFLKENSENLTDEQKETYKDVLTKKEEEEDIDPDKIDPETRFKEEEKEVEKKKEGEEEDAIDSEDEKVIGKIVDKKMKGYSNTAKELQTIKDEREVESFIASKPEYAKYKPAIMKYVSHPAYKNIPVYNIAAIVAAKDLEKIGAQKEREAQKTAAATKTQGTQFRKSVGKTDWHNATKAEYDAQRLKIMGHQG